MELIKEKFSKQAIIVIVVLILAALVSNLLISKIVSDPSNHAETIKSLDEKKITVTKLAAGAAASSTALSLLPGDVATPIAKELAELSKYFLIILSAIILEKTLVAVVGYVSFSWIIPIAFISGAIYVATNLELFGRIAWKLFIFGLVIFLAIPMSIEVSDIIYSTYENSLEQTIETTYKNNNYINEKKEELSKEDKGWMEKIGDYFSDLTSKIGIGLSEIVKKGEDTFSKYLDSIAVLIITTCVIPIIVILIFVWVIKILFGFEIGLPRVPFSKGARAIKKANSTSQ